MTIFEAIGWVTSVVAASALIGLVTSRITAHWLQLKLADVQLVTIIGAALPAVVAFFMWGSMISDHYRIEPNVTYFAVFATLSALVIGSSVAFLMIAVSIVKQIYTTMCAVIDRMFAKRN